MQTPRRLSSTSRSEPNARRPTQSRSSTGYWTSSTTWSVGGQSFRLRVSIIQQLHRLALEGLSAYAGNWRPGDIRIGKSSHNPPGAYLVAGLMEEMCDWVNDRWSHASPITLCSYVMWRLNWIHPFNDGNGRTSRAVAYLVLPAAAGHRFPSRVTSPN